MLMNRLCVASNFQKINRSAYLLLQRTIKTKTIEEDPEDKPILLSTTEAATWKAAHSRMPPNERSWITPYAVSGSVAILLIYFCILREENDIDEIIYRPLPETLKGIDKAFPHMDFQTKPDYVRYHDEIKKKKLEEQQANRELNHPS